VIEMDGTTPDEGDAKELVFKGKPRVQREGAQSRKQN
jgi:hypothetical protein